MSEPAGELILYRADDGGSVVQLRAVGGTVWLTRGEMADLYGTTPQNVGQIVARVLADGEVGEATRKPEFLVRQEGAREVRRRMDLYNLDMVLAVGYRVTTPRAVQFRQWATTVLTEYLVKGFALQDERLKDPGADYFDELLERIRDIRASEKRFYLKVRDLFATTSADYDSTSDVARTFFATIQNKLLHAVTGRTAGELIRERCDPASGTLGLTTWKGNRPRKADASVAKNYLTEEEVSDLNLLTTQFLDFAEGRARRRQTTSMADWVVQADRFIEFNEYPVLTGAGSVAHSHVEQIVAERYADWDDHRRELESQRASADEITDLDALLEAERNLTQGEQNDGHQPE
ncbi:RhuM family protein [Cellulomonas taurus]|uniref:RhuM family protein n=1 Tax=Cellulomonas taurus TaxID=2729175 RepID=UPI00145E576A|nr:RhuM family protein [Cellulomonas taurus]